MYEIIGLLGAGGMGEVFRARDTRLDREVAIKVLPEQLASDTAAVARFEREAKAVARLSHPNIVAIHDFSADHGIVYAVTELLDGRTLREEMAAEPLSPDRAIQIALAVAEGLAAAHDRGVIHRDLKPENIFVTRDRRVKILDFGLALTPPTDPFLSFAPTQRLDTMPGTIMGTVGYIAPEQIRGEHVSAAADVFAFGCVLYEMLGGSRPFTGSNAAATFASVLVDEPLPLPSTVRERIRQIVSKCLAKDPARRFANGAALLEAMRSGMPVLTEHAAKRIIVLPFRMLRRDPEFDFLANSLPDAITTSLTSLDSVIVRSSAIAARFDSADPKVIAADAAVDWIISGTLLRSGDQLRVSSQLVDAQSGRVLWSHTVESSVGDIFSIQDGVTRPIVNSLSVAPSERERKNLRRDVPASALGYELYLRANQQGRGNDEIMLARDLYLRSIEEDPNFAPAHARLARMQWLLAKYAAGREDDWAAAEESLQRALQLNPDLPLAHRLYAELEIDLGRAVNALERLLKRIAVRPLDAELQMALVKACRYCGLLDQSVAAHLRARELDPQIMSSVAHTYFMKGDYENALRTANREDIGFIEAATLMMMENADAARRKIEENLARITDDRLRAYIDLLRHALDRNADDVLSATQRLQPVRDPEALFYVARSLIFAGATEAGLAYLDQAVPGYPSVSVLDRDPWLDPVRTTAHFRRLLDVAKVRHDAAVERYARLTAG